jgi:HemY protein
MRGLIIFLIFLLGSVWAGVMMVQHPGYVFISYKPWMVQMPLWFALCSLIALLVLFYLLIHGMDCVQFFWFRFKNWRRFRREHKAYSKTQHGLSLLIEGRWKKAENLLLAGVNQTMEPLINYLGAAKAAQEQGAYARRETYIQKAYEIAPNADLAIGLTQAELELEHDQLEHAAATLNRLRSASPRHPRVLKLLEKVYVRLADWKNLQALLPGLRKANVLNAEQSEQFEKNLYCEILRSASTKSNEEIHQLWNDMPRAMRKNPDVVCEYVKQLSHFPETKESEELIRKTLKHHWQPELVKQYGHLPLTNLNKQLVIVGAWLKLYGQQAETLLLLGKLCVRVQLWGKAKDYFDKCLALGPNAEASLAYGNLLEHLGESDAALEKYRDGLQQLPEPDRLC